MYRDIGTNMKEFSLDVRLGKLDVPSESKQPEYSIDLMSNNIAVFGGAHSGKTTFVKTLLRNIHESCEEEISVYIVDFAGDLFSYERKKYIYSYVTGSDEEGVKRVIRKVDLLREENVKRRRENSAEIPVILIIDNINIFLGEKCYESYVDTLFRLCRDGLSNKVSVVFTSGGIEYGVGRLLCYFKQKIAFSLNADKYAEVFDKRVQAVLEKPGRGYATTDSIPTEFQCYYPFYNEEDELEYMSKIGKWECKKEKQYRKVEGFLKEYLTLEEVQAEVKTLKTVEEIGEITGSPADVLLGVDYSEHKPVGISLNEKHIIGIFGKKGAGKKNISMVIAEQMVDLHGANCRWLLFDDSRKRLDGIKEKLKNKSVQEDNIIEVLNVKDLLDKLPETDEPIVLFLQNRNMYSGLRESEEVREKILEHAVCKSNMWVVFTDVKNISGYKAEQFYDAFSIFLILEDIVDFAEKNGRLTPLKYWDMMELKNEYAKRKIGDGFFYDVDADELMKVKLIKCKE